MADMGINVEKHHHEVAPSQHELGIKFGTLIETADNMQLYKYTVHQVACLWSVSNLPAKADRRRQWVGHACPQSIWNDGKPLFAGNGYAACRKARCSTSAASSSMPSH